MSHIVLVSGSHRQNSQSRKVAGFVETALKKLDISVTTDIIELTGNPLPLWDGESAKPDSATGKAWQPMAARLQKADGLVIVSPEWHGMVPAGLKNFFLHTTTKEVGHKPALIVTVSASRGGAYPVAELRSSSYKNSRIAYLPEHIIVSNCNHVLNGETEADKDDAYIRRRISWAANMLLTYTEAFKSIRAAGVESPDFANGM